MSKPVVLFVCVHNAGRSMAARVLLAAYAGEAIEALSAGSEPGTSVNPVVVKVLADRGHDATREAPKVLVAEDVRRATVAITMGCGDACPIFPGVRYEDWPIEDPAGQDEDAVARIVDDIDVRVRTLVKELLGA
jgi:protein-tyrosine-phosphatase